MEQRKIESYYFLIRRGTTPAWSMTDWIKFRKWIDDNAPTTTVCIDTNKVEIIFDNENDATLFVLRWGDTFPIDQYHSNV